MLATPTSLIRGICIYRILLLLNSVTSKNMVLYIWTDFRKYHSTLIIVSTIWRPYLILDFLWMYNRLERQKCSLQEWLIFSDSYISWFHFPKEGRKIGRCKWVKVTFFVWSKKNKKSCWCCQWFLSAFLRTWHILNRWQKWHLYICIIIILNRLMQYIYCYISK